MQKYLQFFTSLTLFLLPWQTILLVQERYVGGAKWEYGTTGFYAVEMLVWLCIVLFMIWFWQKAKGRIHFRHIQPTPDRLFVFSLLLFVLYLFASTLWAPFPDIAWQQALRVLSAILFFFVLFLGPLSFDDAVLWFVAGGVVQAVFALGQFFLQTSFSSTLFGLSTHDSFILGTSVVADVSMRFLRAYGSFAHPNIFGGYMLALLILSFCLLKKGSAYDRFVVWAAPLLCAGLFVSFSRSAWIGFLILSIFIIAQLSFPRKRESTVGNFEDIAMDSRFRGNDSTANGNDNNGESRRTGIFFLSTIIVFALFSFIFSPLLHTRLSGSSYTENISTSERVGQWPGAFSLFQESPFFGVGAGQYTAALIERFPEHPGWFYQPIHNIPALLLVEIGMVGCAMVLGVCAVFMFLCFRVFFTKYGFFELFLLFIPFAPIVLFDHYVWTQYTGVLLCAVVFGLLLKAWTAPVHTLSTKL